MTILADMTRTEVSHWLNYHGQIIGCARDEFVEALTKYARTIAQCNGVWEANATTPASFVEQVLDRADSLLADEVKRDLGL